MAERARPPTDAERRLLDAIIRQHAHELPEGVRSVEFEFGEDATGDPAVWILFRVGADVQPTSAKIDEIDNLAQTMKSEIIGAGAGHWPYVRIQVGE
jgi:hypothetical protein